MPLTSELARSLDIHRDRIALCFNDGDDVVNVTGRTKDQCKERRDSEETTMTPPDKYLAAGQGCWGQATPRGNGQCTG